MRRAAGCRLAPGEYEAYGKCYAAWHCLNEARASFDTNWLENLRALIGEEMYQQGMMPPPLPLQYLQRAD